MPHSPSILVTIAGFALLLGPLVTIHELGHYFVGRLFGVKVDAFSIGFGRELLGWTGRRGTRWKLSMIPLGGYVQFAGDWNAIGMPDEALNAMSPHDRAQTFHAKPLWQRALIVLAGPLTNLLFAIAIFAAFNFAYGKVVIPPEVGGFSRNSAAQAAGLRQGDRIVAIGGEAIADFNQIAERVLPYPGRTIVLTVRRGPGAFEVPVRIAEVFDHDRFGNELHIGRLGISSNRARTEVAPVGVVESVTLAWRQTAAVMRLMVTGLGQILTGERPVSELGGPIKIAKFSGEQLSLGWLEFVSFTAMISINLAFINVLPIPALDGGHLAFYAAEAVRRKPLGQRSQEWAFRAGLALVLGLMLFVTINDIAGLLPRGG